MGTYYVTKAGNDSTGDGSESTPWLTVSKAVTVAKAVAGSHTIMIGPGTYNEQLTVNPSAGGMTACKFQGTTGDRADVVIHNKSTGFGAVRAEGILETLEAEDVTFSTGTNGVVSCVSDTNVVFTNVGIVNTGSATAYGGLYFSNTSAPTRSNVTWIGGSCTLASASGSCIAWYTSPRHVGRVYIEDVAMDCAYVVYSGGTENGLTSLDLVNCELTLTQTVVHLKNTTLGTIPMPTYVEWVSVRGCTGTVKRLYNIAGGVTDFEFRDNNLSVTSDGSNNATLGYQVRTDTISVWTQDTVIAENAIRRATVVDGRLYQATTGGTTHATTEPTWDTEIGATTPDGTVVWTCIAAETTNAMPFVSGRIVDNVLDWPTAGATHHLFLGIGADNIMVLRNTLTTASTENFMVVCKSDLCVFERNLIVGPGSHTFYLSGCHYAKVLHNTMVNTGTTTCLAIANHQEGEYSLVHGTPRGCVVEGNILVSATGQPITVNASGGALVDRNLYWTGGANVAYVIDASVAISGGIAAVQAKWASAGTGIETRNDADSIVADPLFDEGYRLSPSSPARGVGGADALDLGAFQSAAVASVNRPRMRTFGV